MPTNLENLEIDREKIQKKCKSFTKLLESIDSIEDKKKILWAEIYENCVMDRENSFIMFMNLYVVVNNDPAAHAIHGATIAKYLERMNKANDQLLRLAELLQAAEKKNSSIDPDDIYSRMTS
jgi:hypothetical protein